MAAPTLPKSAGNRIAVLVPLSGNTAETGRTMLRAARLALQTPPGAAFDERDTQGTPAGARRAAEQAIAGGAGLIVGPLTSADTDAVAAVAVPRQVPVLAFTSDDTKAQPGVWALGITPWQQARALLRAAAGDGRHQFGALLPRNLFGDALAAGLTAAAQEAGLSPPVIARYAGSAPPDDAIASLAKPPSGPVDAILLGSTVSGATGMLPALQAAGLGPDHVRWLGTALWTHDANAAKSLAGAWFVGPEPGALRIFEQNYTARYGSAPREVAAVAFDAAGAAHAAAGPDGIDAGRLLAPGGFAGANGVFTLLPDGHVHRELGVFEITPEGVRPRSPPPTPRTAAAG